MSLGQPERQRSTHRQTREEYLFTLGSQRPEGVVHAVVPVRPGGLIAFLPSRAVARQPGQQDLETCSFEVSRPPDHGLRRAGEAMAEQHSGRSAATCVRLCSWMH